VKRRICEASPYEIHFSLTLTLSFLPVPVFSMFLQYQQCKTWTGLKLGCALSAETVMEGDDFAVLERNLIIFNQSGNYTPLNLPI